ncbi:MAG: CRISPR-associated helicase Cas3' [Candidatus Krumholzibacteriota bacterium]|nr:CRISPR-associated helicase Cas3' [Candidatus Krumholzibacteriota bacterium]
MFQYKGYTIWGKTKRGGTSNRILSDCQYHPLLYHMLDVAAVAGLVWDQFLSQQIHNRFKCSLGTDARTQVVFLAGAHDIGKASPGFQKKVQEISQNLGLPFTKHDHSCPHGIISAHVLNDFLGSCSAAAVLSQIAGGHHGVFPRSTDLRMGVDTLGNKCWSEARNGLLLEFADIVDFDLSQVARKMSEIRDPALVPMLAGLISVVDWIGSNQDYFRCVAKCETPIESDAEEYWIYAQNQAQNALEKLGWLPAVSFADETRFDAVFSGFIPNILQTTAIELASNQHSPYLMIVEAPMGLGKTEVAFYAADMAMCRGFACGMYIAMPTQATGNAMYKRVSDDYLGSRGHQGKLNLQLVHGDARLAQEEVKEGEISEFKPTSIGDEGDVRAQSWFTARKRPLLATFGVGTIDQSLLSVLQTRHWFVRLFGLAGKVVIFDEVHAYDTYMSTILERLLHWLAEVDCTIILLSATLPEAKREAFVKAYSGRNECEHKRYPRITLAKPRRYPNDQAASSPVCAEIQIEKPYCVDLHFSETGLTAITESLRQHLEHGGCAAVICNTVNRAIEIYKYLRDNLMGTECMLFQARTLRKWRQERESEVLRKFGKGAKQPDGTYANPERPIRAVLVATQVIEQSLDLDFDIMFSEIAPVDLLLQRSGRLHRHRRQRPDNLETPRFIVLCDAESNGLPPQSFGQSIEFVYDRYVLLRTWLALRQRKKLGVPNEIEELVEAVYGELTPCSGNEWNAALEEAKQRMEYDCNESAKAASRLLVNSPRCPCDLIEEFNYQLVEDEDPRVHKTIRAATREGDPSITVVIVPEDKVLATSPDVSDVRELLDYSVKLSHRGIFRKLFESGESPEEWAKNAYLRHIRLLRYDANYHGRIGNYTLTVDEILGVVIEKDRDTNG